MTKNEIIEVMNFFEKHMEREINFALIEPHQSGIDIEYFDETDTIIHSVQLKKSVDGYTIHKYESILPDFLEDDNFKDGYNDAKYFE